VVSGNGTQAYDLTGSGAALDGNGAAVLNFNTTLGTISVTGGIAAPQFANLGNNSVLLSAGPGALFSSNITSANGHHTVTIAAFSQLDTKNSLLLADLGIPVNPVWDFTLTLSGTRTTSRVPTTFTAFSTDLGNLSEVPEPGSMMLFGTGLIGLTSALRR